MSTAVTVVFSTLIFLEKRDVGIPKESQGLSRCNHHGFAPLSSFSDLNISSKKKKFSGPRHSSPSASFLEKSLMPPPTSQPNLLQCSPTYTWPGTKSLTHEEEEEFEFTSANEVWVHGGDKAVHQLTA